MHVIAAKAVAFHEALDGSFKGYIEQVVKNAKALADAMLGQGFDLVSGGTDNHLLLVDLQKMNITGKDAEEKLDSVGITCNKNAVPYDPLKPTLTSGIRLGTPAITTRGMDEADMKEIAKIIANTLRDYDGYAETARSEVKKLTDRYPLYT
jgi:glycine hydroxymethyltransferase